MKFSTAAVFAVAAASVAADNIISISGNSGTVVIDGTTLTGTKANTVIGAASSASSALSSAVSSLKSKSGESSALSSIDSKISSAVSSVSASVSSSKAAASSSSSSKAVAGGHEKPLAVGALLAGISVLLL